MRFSRHPVRPWPREHYAPRRITVAAAFQSQVGHFKWWAWPVKATGVVAFDLIATSELTVSNFRHALTYEKDYTYSYTPSPRGILREDGAMRKRAPGASEQDLDQLTTLFRLLADKTRLNILLLLADGERNVTNLCETLRLPQPTVSHHLGLLRM